MKYNLKAIMIRAWKLFRKLAISFAEALHRSWLSEKAKPVNAERIAQAKAAAGVTEETATWSAWRDAGFEVLHGSKALFSVELIHGSKTDSKLYFFGYTMEAPPWAKEGPRPPKPKYCKAFIEKTVVRMIDGEIKEVVEEEPFDVICDDDGTILTDLKLLKFLYDVRYARRFPVMITNKALVSMATYKPLTKEAFVALDGLGEGTYSKSGEEFIKAILSYRTVYDCFKRIVKKMGCPNLRFHDLRHQYAVIAIKNGDDIKTIQSNLGHATAAFTLDVYGHVTDEMRRDSADRMESYMQALSDS